MQIRRCLAAAVLASIVAPAVTGVAAGTGPDDPAGEARRWHLLRGWLPLLGQPDTAPQERWTSDVLRGFDGNYTAFIDTTFIGIEEAPAGIVVTAVDVQTGERLWATDIDLADYSSGNALLTRLYELGEGAIGITATRDDATDDSPSEYILLDLATADVLWRGVEGDECCLDMAVTADLVVVDGTAIDRQTGDWSWHSEGDLDTSGSHLLVESGWDAEEPGFGVVDPATGELAWWEPIDSSEPVVDETFVAADTVIRMVDGEEPVIEGYNLLTGTRLWTTPIDDIDVDVGSGRAIVTALGDNLAMISEYEPDNVLPWDSPFFHSGGAGLDLVTGSVLWQADADIPIGYAIDDHGRPRVIRQDAAAFTVLDGTTGAELAELPCSHDDPAYRFGVVDGAVLCVTTERDADESSLGQTVTLIDLDDASERWRVELPAEEFFFLTIDGGFVTSRAIGEGDDREFELVGYGA